MTWNLFHGRDAPPQKSLYTWRSRLTGRAVKGRIFAQVNEDLLPSFSQMIAGSEWDVALLQECPPRWADTLATACGAEPASTLTSRNSHPRIRSWIAERNPDLIASGEGGSNLTLIRSNAGEIVLHRELELRDLPERRVMGFTETASGLCLANVHLTNDQPSLAARELLEAARQARRWAGDRPLILGGDFNLRPGEDRGYEVFETLEGEFGLRGATGPGYIDHLLSTCVATAPPLAWPDAARDADHPDGLVRLSDHSPVEARFACS